MEQFAEWIGRSETVRDIAAADRFEALAALLDHPVAPVETVPPLGHWLLGRPNPRRSEIGPDGHPRRGEASLLPPIMLPRRMWAGSRVEFLRPIPIGAAVERRTTIASIDAKQGRSGEMLFVALDHEVSCDGAVAIRERQNLVYRGEQSAAAVPPPAPPPPRQDAARSRVHRPTTVELFRYSALTLNGHRIHYDADYARDVEGYPGLIVHGPLAATLLLDFYCSANPGRTVTDFTFRARAPLFDTAPFRLCANDEMLWIETLEGVPAMTAEVGVQG